MHWFIVINYFDPLKNDHSFNDSSKHWISTYKKVRLLPWKSSSHFNINRNFSQYNFFFPKPQLRPLMAAKGNLGGRRRKVITWRWWWWSGFVCVTGACTSCQVLRRGAINNIICCSYQTCHWNLNWGFRFLLSPFVYDNVISVIYVKLNLIWFLLTKQAFRLYQINYAKVCYDMTLTRYKLYVWLEFLFLFEQLSCCFHRPQWLLTQQNECHGGKIISYYLIRAQVYMFAEFDNETGDDQCFFSK